jgi:hypothetical protein
MYARVVGVMHRKQHTPSSCVSSTRAAAPRQNVHSPSAAARGGAAAAPLRLSAAARHAALL